jgi:sugar-phosphatase
MGSSVPVRQDRAMRELDVDAVLFDMDGTLVDSDAVVARVWAGWARRYDVDLATVMRVTPGRPADESMRDLAPWMPEEQRLKEADELLDQEKADLDGIVATPGSLPLLSSLTLPWAIVTSADRPLALGRLGAAGITPPPVMITASETTRGKPDPEGYLTAASLLGVDPARALVVEDSTAGVRAGKAAGCVVATLRGISGGDVPLSLISDLIPLLSRQ